MIFPRMIVVSTVLTMLFCHISAVPLSPPGLEDDQVAMETLETGFRVPQLSDMTSFYDTEAAIRDITTPWGINLQVSESRHEVNKIRLPRHGNNLFCYRAVCAILLHLSGKTHQTRAPRLSQGAWTSARPPGPLTAGCA